jgi:hypothetical protein
MATVLADFRFDSSSWIRITTVLPSDWCFPIYTPSLVDIILPTQAQLVYLMTDSVLVPSNEQRRSKPTATLTEAYF